MPGKLSEELKEGDAVAVVLRGGAGWLRGTVVWVKEAQMLLKHAEPGLDEATPYVLVDLSEVTGIAVPRALEPESKPAVLPGFARG